MIQTESPILDHLTKTHILSQDLKDIILTEQERSGRSPESLLLEMGLISEDELMTLIAEVRQCSLVNLVDYQESISVYHSWLPYAIWEKCLAVPIAYDTKTQTLKIAMADVSDIQAVDTLVQSLPKECALVTFLAKKTDVLTALQAIAPTPNIRSDVHFNVDDHLIHQFLYKIIVSAVKARASDIHFEPESFFIRVRYRCDGLLQTIHCFHQSFWQALCIQLKILASMDIAETRRSQDGRFSLSVMGRSISFRMASHPTIHGESIVLRILDTQKTHTSIEQLGYSNQNLERIYSILKKPEGLVIMTGPTGSGKTTSLYSVLSMLDKEQLNIMTLEEPVEYHLSHIRQSEVREQSAFTFAQGMHSILRQDPDVILIGEIRDEQTAEMAIRASMTGHLVFTTLHTIHALGTIYRLKELKISLSLLAGVLNGIIAQRLIRILCPHCKILKELSSQEAQKYKIWPQVRVYEAKGCELCLFSGYKGRKAIAEVIVMDGDLENMILNEAPLSDIQQFLFHKGFKNLKSDALDAVMRGESSLLEIHRVLGI